MDLVDLNPEDSLLFEDPEFDNDGQEQSLPSLTLIKGNQCAEHTHTKPILTIVAKDSMSLSDQVTRIFLDELNRTGNASKSLAAAKIATAGKARETLTDFLNRQRDTCLARIERKMT